MKNDDIRKIPTTRVTLNPPSAGNNSRNKSVVKVSAKHLHRDTPKRNGSDNRPDRKAENIYFDEERTERRRFDVERPDNRRSDVERTERRRSDVERPERRSDRSGGGRERGSMVAELIFSLILLAAVSSFRTVLVYANNTDLISFSDVSRQMFIYMCISIAVFSLLRIFIRRPYFACVFVVFGTFLIINLDWLIVFMRLFFNEYRPAAIGSLILAGVLLIGFFFLLRLLYKKRVELQALTKILAATFTCLVLFNVVTAFVAVGHAAATEEPEPSAPLVAEVTPSPTPDLANVPTTGPAPAPTSDGFGLPNIYFFIMDEFSSFDMLDKYYGYDAKPFNDYLLSAGFNVSRESYGTDNQTEHAISDLMNLDYISRRLDKDECISAIRKGKLHDILKDLGYTEYQIANSKYFKGMDSLINGQIEEGDDDPSENTAFGDQGTDDITGGIGGIFGNLLNDPDSNTKVDTSKLNGFGFYPSDYIRDSKACKAYKNRSQDARNKLAVGAGLLKKFDYLQNPASYKGPKSPRITYSYMLATHVPFLFNEYGGIISYNDNRNWEKKSVYANQYKFMNKELIASIASIIKNDPESIIILMSDHGIRYHAESNLRLKMNFVISDKDSCRIMNAVYIKGQKYNIEGLSGVNTLRFIMSLYEGHENDYPPIEDPITSGSPSCLKGIIPHSRHS